MSVLLWVAPLPSFAPALRPGCSAVGRSCLRMDESADEWLHHANPTTVQARRDILLDKQLHNGAAQPAWRAMKDEAPRPPAQRPAATRDASRPQLDPADAFERGFLLGFSMAQGLPALPTRTLPRWDAPEFVGKGAGPGMAPCNIKLIGVGGGGGNTLNRVAQLDLGAERENCIEYVACNTDAQVLETSLATRKIQIGNGLGAGGVPSVGETHALECTEDLTIAVGGADMVFVTAGMGGGTGSGAAPVVAQLSKEAGCLTIGIVTTPFSFEGRVRMQQAEAAIAKFEQHTDVLIVVSNDRLLEIVPEGLPIEEAFLMADEVMRQGITGMADIVMQPGLINVDFADVRSIMQGAGRALMGIGRGFGANRAHDAAVAAVSSPLLDFPVADARGVVFTITGNSDMSLQEVNEVASLIGEMVSPDANIIFGTTVDESFGDEISVTLVATGFPARLQREDANAAYAAWAATNGAHGAAPPAGY